VVSSVFCFGQTFSATIAGSVTDAAGAAVSRAKIQLKNIGTQDIRETNSDTDGHYRFDNLLPATYEITPEAPGHGCRRERVLHA
jgi:hypothetical protein